MASSKNYYTPSYGLNARSMAKRFPIPDMTLKDKSIPGLMAPCVTQEDVYNYCIAHGLMKKTEPRKKEVDLHLEDLIEEELYLKTHIRRNTFGQWSYLPPPSPGVSSTSNFDNLDTQDPSHNYNHISHPPRSPSRNDYLAPESAYETWSQQLRRSFDGSETSPSKRWFPSNGAGSLKRSSRSPHGNHSSFEYTGSCDSIGGAPCSTGPIDVASLIVPEAFYMWSPPDQERFLGMNAPRAPDGSYLCCGERFGLKAFVEHRRSSDEHGGFGQGSRRRS